MWAMRPGWPAPPAPRSTARRSDTGPGSRTAGAAAAGRAARCARSPRRRADPVLAGDELVVELTAGQQETLDLVSVARALLVGGLLEHRPKLLLGEVPHVA